MPAPGWESYEDENGKRERIFGRTEKVLVWPWGHGPIAKIVNGKERIDLTIRVWLPDWHIMSVKLTDEGDFF